MTFWGTLKDGSQMLLGEPRSASLTYDWDAPADLLEAVFPADRVWEELVWVTACRQGETVFRGLVDEQNTRLTDSGITVELVCRSGEALLLDNEAPPGTIQRPTLEKLGKTLLEPLGITRVVGEAAAPGELPQPGRLSSRDRTAKTARKRLNMKGASFRCGGGKKEYREGRCPPDTPYPSILPAQTEVPNSLPL